MSDPVPLILDPARHPSRLTAPLWPPWSMTPAANPPKARQQPVLGGYRELVMLVEAVWPNAGPKVTFEEILGRAQFLNALYPLE